MIPIEEVVRILDQAATAGIDTIDTAYVYGSSEEAIGIALKETGRSFKIISKFPDLRGSSLDSYVEISRKRLGVERLYGYLYHDFKTFEDDPKTYIALQNIKKSEQVEKIGFSIYLPSELEKILRSDIPFDILQIPFNVFDQRFLPWLPTIAARNCEIHVRSVFLQGLLLMDPFSLPSGLSQVSPRIESIRKNARDLDFPLERYLLAFPALNDNISKIIIGIDKISDLHENIDNYENIPQGRSIDFSSHSVVDEKILLPMNWGR